MKTEVQSKVNKVTFSGLLSKYIEDFRCPDPWCNAFPLERVTF